MRHVLLLASFLSAQALFAVSQIQSVKVVGEKSADIQFSANQSLSIPLVRSTESGVELTFSNAEVSESIQGKLDLDSPHVLIRRLSVFSPEKGVVRAKIVVNGSVERIKDRISVQRAGDGISIGLEYPSGESATLNLLKEEQKPIAPILQEGKKDSGKLPYLQWILVFVVVLIAGAVTFIFMRTMKGRGGLRGTRRYLIEQLGYVSLGAKTGVSLLKIGREFVLVGVTPNQVSILSSLPKLAEQYDDETRFERGVFQDAVSEEVSRIKSSSL